MFLGSGAFGEVFEGVATNILGENSGSTKVAVKVSVTNIPVWHVILLNTVCNRVSWVMNGIHTRSFLVRIPAAQWRYKQRWCIIYGTVEFKLIVLLMVDEMTLTSKQETAVNLAWHEARWQTLIRLHVGNSKGAGPPRRRWYEMMSATGRVFGSTQQDLQRTGKVITQTYLHLKDGTKRRREGGLKSG